LTSSSREDRVAEAEPARIRLQLDRCLRRRAELPMRLALLQADPADPKPVLSSCPRVDIAGQRPLTCALAVSAPLGAAAPVARAAGSANSRQSGASRASAGALIATSQASPRLRGRGRVAIELEGVAVGAEGGIGQRGRGASLRRLPGPAAATPASTLAPTVDVGAAAQRGERLLPWQRADRWPARASRI
jgi:hypothetical protein